MNRGKAVKPLKELNLTNRFLFDEVMEDAETHRTVKGSADSPAGM